MTSAGLMCYTCSLKELGRVAGRWKREGEKEGDREGVCVWGGGEMESVVGGKDREAPSV